MAKAIVFDLDGVLVDSKEIHFNALNLALSNVDPKYIISKTEQSTTFEGLTTKSKLLILSHTKGLPEELHNAIWKKKQEYSAALFESICVDKELVTLFEYIKMNQIGIGVASNSIRITLNSCLRALGIEKYVDVSMSNEDVKAPKPNPEIYLKTFDCLGINAKDAIIFEDSSIGLAAAKASKAKVIKVLDRNDLTVDKITQAISYLNGGD